MKNKLKKRNIKYKLLLKKNNWIDRFIFLFEFDDGSEWTLCKCLTHANRTSIFNFLNYLYWSGVQVSNWYYGYLGVRQNKSLIRTTYYSLLILNLIQPKKILLK